MVGCACFLGRRFVANQQGAMGLQGAVDYTETQVDLNGKLIGDQAESDWLKVTPWGFRLMLNWVNNRCASAAHHHVWHTYELAGEKSWVSAVVMFMNRSASVPWEQALLHICGCENI